MSAYREAALLVARRITADAIWHDGRCSWVAPVPAVRHGRPTIAARSLSSDLYAGTAGIGLALAEVAVATGDNLCRVTALGALRHAIRRTASPPTDQDFGLYVGSVGTALAVTRAGRLLGEEELIRAGTDLAQHISESGRAPAASDLVNGRAGAIIGLLALGVATCSTDLFARAAVFGDELIAAAAFHGAWAWTGQRAGTGLDPSGLAHGAAGAALALLELAECTHEARFALAAGEAMTDEDAFRDPPTGNWLDGGEAAERSGASIQRSFVHWCHGAPGIALVRDRAARLGGDPARRDDARSATALTDQWVRAALGSGRGAFCLCHGVPGNAEIVDDCADPPEGFRPARRRLSEDVAIAGLVEYLQRSRPFPSGAPGGQTPALMTGLAGIARFYQRLAEPSLPSLLRIRPSEWAPPVMLSASSRGPSPR